MTMRSEKMEQAYQQAKQDGTLIPLVQEPKLRGAPDFQYWKIIANRFPHDRHHSAHVLIVLKRDCPVDKISLEELEELWFGIFPWADKVFDYVKLNLSTLRSINHTPHLHLCVLKPDYK